MRTGFGKFAALYLLRDKLVTHAVIRATKGFNLQCNNVARQVEGKCCPYNRTFKPIVLWRSRNCCHRACVSFYQRQLSSNNPEARFSKVPKSHSRNFDPLILKSWSFYVLSGELKLVCGRSFVPWDAVVLKMQTWSTPEKFRDFRETGPMAELFEFR